ncbi:MAG TPA: DoxX family protein [Puia sp.]
METQNVISKPIWWTGTILKGLLCLFLAFDAIMKLINNSQSVEGTKQMGLPESSVQFLGIYLLLSTILYIYPRTVMLGMLFLSAYLGAAVGITYRANIGGHPYIFPIVFAMFIVIVEFLRNGKIRNIVPFAK